MSDKLLEGNEFAVQIISKGAFVDHHSSGCDKKYVIEATTLRLNWVALREWHNAHTSNCRDCYEDGPEGDAEWKSVLEKNKADLKAFEGKIKTVLGIDLGKAVVIAQVHSEVFTVVHIHAGKE